MPEIMPGNIPSKPNMPAPWLWIPRDVPSVNLDIATNATLDIRMEEYYRLLYVAMTRAKEELYVYAYTPKDKPDKRSWYSLLWDVLQTTPCATVDNETIRIIHGK